MTNTADPDQAEHEQISTSLEIEQLDTNLFRSKSLWLPFRSRGVFGGQVISQAVVAATKCVKPEYALHVSTLLCSTVFHCSNGSFTVLIICAEKREYAPVSTCTLACSSSIVTTSDLFTVLLPPQCIPFSTNPLLCRSRARRSDIHRPLCSGRAEWSCRFCYHLFIPNSRILATFTSLADARCAASGRLPRRRRDTACHGAKTWVEREYKGLSETVRRGSFTCKYG